MDCNEIKFSRNALIQMFAHSIAKIEVVKVIKSGETVTDYPDDNPLPSKLLLGYVDNRPIHVVLGYDRSNKSCIVITAYQPYLKYWKSDFKTRRQQ